MNPDKAEAIRGLARAQQVPLGPQELDEIQALAEADFNGLPREALVASIHYLAETVVHLNTGLLEALQPKPG